MTDNCWVDDTATTLPADFAERVLELQATVDEDRCELTTITSLSDLYRMAVEHFQQQRNEPRSKHYQRKLTRLLMNPRILQLIDNRVKAESKPRLSQDVQTEVEKFNVQAEQYVQSMVQQGQRKLIRSQTLIKLDIDKQEEHLQERLLRRAKSRKML